MVSPIKSIVEQVSPLDKKESDSQIKTEKVAIHQQNSIEINKSLETLKTNSPDQTVQSEASPYVGKANHGDVSAPLKGLEYGSLSATETDILGHPNEKEAKKIYINGYIPTPPEAGQLREGGIANVFSGPWRAQVSEAVERNGGLGNEEDGYLAFAKNGFIRLKNENLTPEQNRKIAEMSLITGTHVEDTPARADQPVTKENMNNWVNTFISRHNKELADFLKDPTDGYAVSDGRRKYNMQFNKEAGAVVSYYYKKSGGLRGFVQKHMKYIQPVLGAVSTFGHLIPGVGTVAALGSSALQMGANAVAYGKTSLSNLAGLAGSFIPGGSAISNGLAAVGSMVESGKVTASNIWQAASSFFGQTIPANIQKAGNFVSGVIDKGKITASDIISGISTVSDLFGSKSSHVHGASSAASSSSSEGSILGKLWNLPNTALGLAWGLAGVPFGAKVSLGNNAIQFENHPFMMERGGITLGNVIAYGEKTGPHEIGDHERQHTYQGEALGPLYLPANLFEGLQGLIFDGHWHGPSNDMESGPQQPNPSPW